jgi:hypothetical protein
MGQAVAPDRRAFMMSRRWTMLGVAKLVSIPIASQLIARMVFPSGYQVVFGANAVLALLALGTISQLNIQERQVVQRPRGQRLRDQIQQSMIEIWSQKPFVVFVSGWAIFNLGLALVSAMVPIYWVSYLQVPDSWIGIFNTTLSAATLVSYTPWVRWKRKLGTWKMLVLSVFGSALYPALLALTRSPVAVLPVIALNGLAGGGVNLAVFDALLEACPRDKQERFIAINMTAVNLMGVIGPPIGAALFGVLSIQWVMAIGTVVSLAGAAVFVVARWGVRKLPVAALESSIAEPSQQ